MIAGARSQREVADLDVPISAYDQIAPDARLGANLASPPTPDGFATSSSTNAQTDPVN